MTGWLVVLVFGDWLVATAALLAHALGCGLCKENKVIGEINEPNCSGLGKTADRKSIQPSFARHLQ
jgi:hypothetical protein